MDGRTAEFPVEQRYLPVSRAVGEPRIGRHLRDWGGTLLGWYYPHASGTARFLPVDSSAPVQQADGEDDGN